MAQRGGYQPPRRPAPVSGPGPMSKRTDGQPVRDLPNPAYGEGKQFEQIQQGARMEQAAGPQITPLGAPTMRPDEPVTAGVPSGPGPGPEAIGVGMSNRDQSQVDARQIARYLPSLERMANRPGTPPSFVRFVKYVRDTSL
jgi:hypothetical protein